MLLGIYIWSITAPEPLLFNPSALISPHLKYLSYVLKDTYVNKICSSHPGLDIPLPCECGSPLNMESKILFPDPEPRFDPLGIEKAKSIRIKSIATYFATIILVIALSESTSHHGIYINI